MARCSARRGVTGGGQAGDRVSSDKTIIDLVPALADPAADTGPGAALGPVADLDAALAALMHHIRAEDVPESLRLLAEELDAAAQKARRKG